MAPSTELQTLEGAKRDRRRRRIKKALIFGSPLLLLAVGVAVFGFGGDTPEPPETLAFAESTPTEVEVIEDEPLEIELDTLAQPCLLYTSPSPRDS